MKLSNRWRGACLLGAMVFSTAALALSPDEEERLKECKRPKFRDFLPEQKAEVDAGAEISFHISHNADPLTVTAEARGEKMKVNVVDKKTFYFVTAKLPSLTPGFARVHLTAKSAESKLESGCLGQDGWLLKIKGEEAAKPAEQPAAAQ
ncbi:hypothetical protein [Methylomonas fluvii]|uniref:Uncharacterized protein n=1 Tax=Methylomonas fluvii TaxID=1854564 RepID=A0ABR9DFG0_9GAMM|nr:hypothetical protein [Methylomonas fluvii]MBD9361819.1 hypothetical protein [Methylomonas fluvii]CAD6874832.1 hypothetical protein [Methylomonas fluvii]